ncbi:hypothetical protein CRUP_014505, partial [Coryphaenoides rupestris]
GWWAAEGDKDRQRQVLVRQAEVAKRLRPPASSVAMEGKQKLVKQLPLENICLETDSPALGPEKQVRNEPKNILVSAEYISKVKGLPLETVVEVTTRNALRLFPKLKLAVRLL